MINENLIRKIQSRIVIGDVKGKNAIIIDDLIDTGTTLSLAAKALEASGAKAVYAGCTHPILTGDFREKIELSPIKELVVTNSIQVPDEKRFDKLKTISIACIASRCYRSDT